MIRRVLVIGLFLLSGCAHNSFSEFYHGNTLEETLAAHYIETPQASEVRKLPDRPLEQVLDELYEEGFILTGYASWEGPYDDGDTEALEQAMAVGAALVLWDADYSHTKHGVTTSTQYHPSRTVYSGMRTFHVPGYTTTHSTPYSIDRYTYNALFMGKLTNDPLTFRARISEVPLSFMRATDSRDGGLVTSVMKDSTVYKANIFPGDIILRINGTPFTPDIQPITLMHLGENTVEIWRDGKILEKTILFSPD